MTSATPPGRWPGRFWSGSGGVRLLMAIVVAALVSACGRASKDPDRASTMTILVSEGDRYTIRRGLMTPLLFLPPLIEEGGIPRLAESWEHSPDYRTWTYQLRENVRWHDGVRVTAHWPPRWPGSRPAASDRGARP